jgi:hypothetical protein
VPRRPQEAGIYIKEPRYRWGHQPKTGVVLRTLALPRLPARRLLRIARSGLILRTGSGPVAHGRRQHDVRVCALTGIPFHVEFAAADDKPHDPRGARSAP